MNKRANPIFLLVGIFFSLVAGIIMVKMLRFKQFDRNPSLFLAGSHPLTSSRKARTPR